MTELLQKAIAEVVKLPEPEQDKFASWLLEEIELDQQVEDLEETLETLIVRAKAEIDAGETLPLEAIL